jgi:hypothetical protein
MTFYLQSYADRAEVRPNRRAKSVVAGAVRALHLTAADALYAYAVTGSAFATVAVLAAPHLELSLRCLFHGKG